MNISNLIIIWNNDNLKDLLRLQYGAANIICSAKELNNHNFSFVQGIIVLCELNWDEHGHDRLPSEFYGIELVKRYFRTLKHLHVPVLFVSVMPKSYFETSPKNMILDALGHSLMQLEPLQWNIWKEQFGHGNLLPLNEIQFADIQSNYCNLGGQIGEVAHRTKGRIANLIHEPEIDRQTKFQNIYNTLNTGLTEICQLLGNSIVALSVRDHLLDQFNKGIILSQDLTRAGTFMQQHEEVLRALADETEVTPQPIAIDRPWKALILDDEPSSLDLLICTLHTNGVKTIVCSHIDEAQKIIEEDEKIQDDHTVNSITVVISDYRLFEPGTKKHQSRQGYDFIFDTAKRDRLTSFVALSGLGRQFLLESFRKYNLRVEIYSKDDLRSSERNRQIFAENIIQLGDSQYDAVCSQSTSRGWNNDGKRRFYIEHRQRQDYFESEKLLSDDARRYINHFTYMHQKGALIGHKPISDLQTSLENKTVTPENIDIFRKILYARRLVFWLYHIVGLDSDAIYLLLTTGEILNLQNRIEPEEVSNNARQQMGKLCIKLTDYPKGFLIEEKSWFKYQMDVDIDDLREVILQLQVHCDLILSKYPLFKKKMMGWKILQSSIEKKTLIIASVGDVKRIIRAIKDNVKDGDTAVIAYKMIEEMITSMLSDVAGEEHMFDVIKKGRECLAILKRRKS